MTVAMALATVTHHSFQAGTAYDALRSQKLLERRPPPLVEVRPQGKMVQHSGNDGTASGSGQVHQRVFA